MANRIVLIGAGSAMFGLSALGDIFKSTILEGCDIVLHDVNTIALERVYTFSKEYLCEHELPYRIFATTNREEALHNADFCVISIEAGDRFRLWEQDWKLPLQYNFPQVYGENGGPGGIFHALRIIPHIVEICKDIERICPESQIINLSNPMSIISYAITQRFPKLKVVGVCHEIALLIKHLPQILKVDFAEISITAGGLNHFSILTEITKKETGENLYPQLLKAGETYFNSIPEMSLFLEFVRIYKHFPVTTDSHFGEHIHWAHNSVDQKGIIDFYSNYMKACTNPVNPKIRLSKGTAPSEYWRVIPIIESIISDSNKVELATNIINNGLIPELPNDMIVEVPAIVNKNGIHGIAVSIPQGFLALLNNRIGVIKLTAQAALTGSKELAFHALLADPVVNNLHKAELLFDAFLAYQSDFLNYLH